MCTTWVQVPDGAREGLRSPWNWRHKLLQAEGIRNQTLGHWKKEHQTLIIMESPNNNYQFDAKKKFLKKKHSWWQRRWPELKIHEESEYSLTERKADFAGFTCKTWKMTIETEVNNFQVKREKIKLKN